MTVPPQGPSYSRPRPVPRYVEPQYLGQRYPVLPPGMLTEAEQEPPPPPPEERAASVEPRAAAERRSLPQGTIGAVALVVVCLLAFGSFFLIRGMVERDAQGGTRYASTPLDDDEGAVEELYRGWIADMNRGQWDDALGRVCPEAGAMRDEMESLRELVEGFGTVGALDLQIDITRVAVAGDRANVTLELTTDGVGLGPQTGVARRDGGGWCILS